MSLSPSRFLPRLAVVVSGVLLCAALALTAVDNLSAETRSRLVDHRLATWEELGWINSQWDLQHAYNDIYSALALVPDAADYHFSLARVHFWKARGLRLWPQDARAERGRTIQRIKAALANRPTWGTAWVYLALAKYEAEEIDAEMEFALTKAIRLGFYETPVQHGVAIVGMRVWDRLSADARILVRGVVHSALTHWPLNQFVIEQAVQTDWTEQIQERIDENPDFRAWVEEFQRRRGLAS